MPLYVYKCHCGATLEVSSSIAEMDNQTCDGSKYGCPNRESPPKEPNKLKREEIPEGGQRMNYNWSKWQL